MAQAVSSQRGPVTGTAMRSRKRRPFLLDLYSTAVGKKYVMAITGIAMMGFVLFHMIGNLKMYLGAADLNHYAKFLEELLYPLAPHGVTLWILRAGLRTMRWSGIIALAFITWHLLDLTFGVVNDHVGTKDAAGLKDVYGNVVFSLQRVPVAIFYVIANVLLGIHLFHGAWSIFQSLGWNNPRFNKWRRAFATGFAAIIVIGNVSFPIAVLAGVVGN